METQLFVCVSLYLFLSCKAEYIDPKNEENLDQHCTYGRPAQDGKYCPFKIESLDNCSPGKTDKKYGFPLKKPCVYLKLNKVCNNRHHNYQTEEIK